MATRRWNRLETLTFGALTLSVVGSAVFAQTSSPISPEVENLIREHRWNHALMQHLVDDYEIVYPFQVRDRNRVAIDTRNYYFTNASIHFDRCTFVIKSSYNRFKLHLAQNRLLIPPGATYKQVFNDTHRTELRGEKIEHCYYQGEVHNEETSKVALSTCDGLRGVIIAGNQTYFILPLQGGDMGRRHAHVLIRAKLHHKLNCAVNGLTEWSLSSSRKQSPTYKRRNRRDGGKETKFIELAVVADQGSFVDHDASFPLLTRFVLEAVNGMDLILGDLNTRVTLVHFETWMSKNPIEVSDDVTQTVLNFVRYASTVLYSDKIDMMLLMTSLKFQRQESTLAISNSVCTARAAGVVSNPNRFEEHQLSVVMAHTAAHILGMKHDDDACDCPDKYGCLMSQSMSGKRMRFVHRFSQCSHADYVSTLSTAQARCLFNKPLEDNVLALCGNRVVDEGEQCDCGSVEECDLIDSCCDPVTCTLREGAECGAGPCCRDCKLLPSSQVCRPADDDCDVPEFCTLKSGQCPPDARRLNGDTCDGGEGYCYSGKCASARKQCIDLWGGGADRAEPECSEKFNILGIESGNCGYDDKNRPKPCLTKNVLCGLLHCKGGVDAPPLPSYYKTEFALMGKSFECKTVTSGTNTTYGPGMAKDGTKCGSNRVCLDRSCVDLTSIAVEPECPTNNVALPCSGHGICTTENTCYCHAGWAGDECGKKLNVSAPALFSAFVTSPPAGMPTSPVAKRAFGNGTYGRSADNRSSGFGFSANVDTYTMFIILGGVAGAVMLILMFLVFCYRRRTKTSLQKKLSAKKRETDRESESSVDTAHRSIRFGSLPSYRDEKMQMKHKKRILHQINETDEKDSISTNKSRESAHSAASSAPPVDDLSFRPPERGILKNGPAVGNGVADHSMSDMEEPHCTSPLLGAPDGYESEPPPYASAAPCRVFQNSLRRLNECDIYRRRLCSDDREQSDLFQDVSSTSDSRCIYQPPLHGTDHTTTNFMHRPSNGIDQCSRRSQSSSPNDYSSDTAPSRCPTAPLYYKSFKDDCDVRPGTLSQQRASPPESVASSKQVAGIGLVKPQPLQLKNIEYLLRQLDHQQQAPISHSTVVSPSSSTTEMSAAEADKMAREGTDDQREEVGSNTESHRDEAGSSRYHLANNGSAAGEEIAVATAGRRFNRASPIRSGPDGDVGHTPLHTFSSRGLSENGSVHNRLDAGAGMESGGRRV